MSAVRQIVERLARGRVLRRRLPEPFSTAEIFVTPDAALRYLRRGRKAFPEDLLAIAEELITPGMKVWDIGANVGVFGFAAAARAGSSGRILCVEPDTWLVQLLRRSGRSQSGDVAPVEALPAAVGAEPHVAEFLIAARGRASNALASAGGRSQMGGVRERHLVPVVTTDHLLARFAPPDVVKIDVEGGEVDVLRGSATLLREHRPLIYIEVGEDQQQEITSLLRDASYALFDPTQPKSERKALDACCFNTLAIPSERAG
ncbi:MAG: FkbM family methyltransferase [Planctomycetota bacterium]